MFDGVAKIRDMCHGLTVAVLVNARTGWLARTLKNDIAKRDALLRVMKASEEKPGEKKEIDGTDGEAELSGEEKRTRVRWMTRDQQRLWMALFAIVSLLVHD